jgi:hypothetical protein
VIVAPLGSMLEFVTLLGFPVPYAHHRHLLTDQCINENIGSTSDVLFSSNLKDTQCIDKDFNYNLNAPKVGNIEAASGDCVECRNDDYFVIFGHCQHFPNGLRRRSMTYEVLSGRICIKPRILVQKNSTYMVPCDCTLEDLRDLSVPIGLGRCQRIIYIKSDPDCSSFDSFPPYNSTYLCPDVRGTAKEVLFISDWANVQARAVHATGITVLQSTTSCEPLRCLENERPESGNFDRYVFRDCTMRNVTNCRPWLVTRDSVRLLPQMDSGESVYTVRLNIVLSLEQSYSHRVIKSRTLY